MDVFGFWPKIFETFIKAWRYTRFHVIGTWSSWYKNLFSTMPYLHLKFIRHMVAVVTLSCFRMVTHSYAASFSLKIILNEANNFFFSQEYQLLEKVNDRFWKYIKNKGEVTLDTFPNFAYVSSYLHLNTLTWKRGCTITSDVQMPRSLPTPF